MSPLPCHQSTTFTLAAYVHTVIHRVTVVILGLKHLIPYYFHTIAILLPGNAILY